MVFKQIFRVAFITLIWKQYKGLIISSLLLIAYLLMVGSVHDDYLTHAKLQKDSATTGISFIYKWLAYGLGILIYFAFHFFNGLRANKKDLNQKAVQANKDAKNDDSDPFAAIRDMDKLRSRADFIEQNKK